MPRYLVSIQPEYSLDPEDALHVTIKTVDLGNKWTAYHVSPEGEVGWRAFGKTEAEAVLDLLRRDEIPDVPELPTGEWPG